MVCSPRTGWHGIPAWIGDILARGSCMVITAVRTGRRASRNYGGIPLSTWSDCATGAAGSLGIADSCGSGSSRMVSVSRDSPTPWGCAVSHDRSTAVSRSLNVAGHVFTAAGASRLPRRVRQRNGCATALPSLPFII